MKYSKNIRLLFLIALSGLFATSASSCKKEGCTDDKAENFEEKAKKDDGTCIYDTIVPTEVDLDGLFLIEEGYAAGAKISVYSDAVDFKSGFSNLYVLTEDSATGALLENGEVSFNPMMDMGTVMHTAPVLNPQSSAPNDKGLYEGGVYWIMPSMAGDWTLSVQYSNAQTDQTGSFTFDVEVMESSNRTSGSFLSDIDGSSVFVCWKMNGLPEVDINDMEIGVFRRESMMSFPPIEGLTIEIEPEMPTMGHGSPYNENPIAGNEAGWYKGKVNFTMIGYWRINVVIKKDGEVLSDDFYFDYEL